MAIHWWILISLGVVLCLVWAWLSSRPPEFTSRRWEQRYPTLAALMQDTPPGTVYRYDLIKGSSTYQQLMNQYMAAQTGHLMSSLKPSFWADLALGTSTSPALSRFGCQEIVPRPRAKSNAGSPSSSVRANGSIQPTPSYSAAQLLAAYSQGPSPRLGSYHFFVDARGNVVDVSS